MTTNQSTSGPDNASVPKLLRMLERVPKVAVFVAVLVITVGLLWTPGTLGAVLTLALAAGAAYLLYTTWSAHTGTSTRLVRILVVVALAAMGIGKLFV